MSLLHRRGGYTLIELIVVILIVGILAAYGMPQYLRSIEVGKADDAVSMVNMVGTINKMFALDHANQYATGQFPAGGSCGARACPAAPPYTACDLVFCKYLADQDFGVKAYNIFACDENVVGACAGFGAGGFTAGVRRKAGAAAPYSTWGFTITAPGVITAYGTTPPTPTY